MSYNTHGLQSLDADLPAGVDVVVGAQTVVVAAHPAGHPGTLLAHHSTVHHSPKSPDVAVVVAEGVALPAVVVAGGVAFPAAAGDAAAAVVVVV